MSQQHQSIEKAIIRPKHGTFLGLSVDSAFRYFFGSNAWVAIAILALITMFLFKEGAGFVGQNVENLRVYREAGLEYVDILRKQSERFTDLTRQLNAIRLEQVKKLLADGTELEKANAELAAFDAFTAKFSEAGAPLYGLVSDLTEVASAAKQKAKMREDALKAKEFYKAQGDAEEAASIEVPEVDFGDEIRILRAPRRALNTRIAREQPPHRRHSPFQPSFQGARPCG